MKRVAIAALALVAVTACDRPTTPIAGDISASAGTPITESATPLDIAVIGDTPYGTAAINLFPTMVNAIDGDPKVRDVVHVGDFKSGSELRRSTARSSS